MNEITFTASGSHNTEGKYVAVGHHEKAGVISVQGTSIEELKSAASFRICMVHSNLCEEHPLKVTVRIDALDSETTFKIFMPYTPPPDDYVDEDKKRERAEREYDRMVKEEKYYDRLANRISSYRK